MPFVKGMKKYPLAGIKKGQRQAKTLLLSAFIESVVNDEALRTKVIKELKSLTGKPFIDSFITLFEYVAPKMQRSEIKQTNINIDFSQMTNEELIEYLNRLQDTE